MSRFLFLAESYNEIYLLCRDAENFLHKDNSVCLYKARQAGEFIVRQFFRVKNFQSGIHRLEKDGLASEEIISKFDFIRHKGNSAVHLMGVSEQEAIDCIDTLVSIAMWYALGTQNLRCNLNRFYIKDFSIVRAYYGEETFNSYLIKYNEENVEVDRIKSDDIALFSQAEIAKETIRKISHQNEVLAQKLAEEEERKKELEAKDKKNNKKNISNLLGKQLVIGSCVALGILFSVSFVTLKNNKTANVQDQSIVSTEDIPRQNSMFINDNKDIDVLEKLAASGDAEAQRKCGIYYFYGTSVSKDYAKALYWFKKAAAVRDGISCYFLGLMNWRGYGISVNLKEAHKYLNYAADHDVADAYYALGTLYLFGHGTPRDEVKAISFFKKYLNKYSDKPNDKYAIIANYYIGITYVINYEKKKDTENIYEGIRYLTFAANQDYYEACYALGYCYHKGIGVDKDLSKAKELLHKAAEHGVVEAKDYLKKLN